MDTLTDSTIKIFSVRYLKNRGDPDSDWIFRETLMASSYARELKEVRQKAFRKIKT